MKSTNAHQIAAQYKAEHPGERVAIGKYYTTHILATLHARTNEWAPVVYLPANQYRPSDPHPDTVWTEV